MRFLFAVLIFGTLAGCGGSVAHHDDPERGEVVRFVPRDHMHDELCGHYHHNERWYFVANHVHRLGCGHHFIGKRWTRITPARISGSHKHDSYCGHYYFNGEWYFQARHHHGARCGHMMRNGRWTLE